MVTVDISNTLRSDAEWNELLYGGTYNDYEDGEVSLEKTPKAFNSHYINPCAYVQQLTSDPMAQFPGANIELLTLSVRQQSGIDRLHKARKLAIKLLDDTQLGELTWRIRYGGTTQNLYDDVLMCNLMLIRFTRITQE